MNGVSMANEELLNILKQGVDVWNKWREANLGVKVDLSGADLREAHLNHADLSGADLSGAILYRANFRGASLIDTNLRQAILQEADLSVTALIRADLRETTLASTNLTGARLWEADLTGSRMVSTIFVDTELSETRGLETIYHHGPSLIGIETIRRSKGKLPVEFLRGCGLSDLEIEAAKLAAPGLDPEQVTEIAYEICRLYGGQPIQFYSCFISYSSLDDKFARRLYKDLQSNGVRCWFAPEDLKIGNEFRSTIGKEIRLRDKLLIILSAHSIRSEWVGDEVEKALAEEKEQGTLKLFPIRLDDAVLQSKDDWAEKIRLRRHIGDFSKNYAAGLMRLLRDLKPS